MKQNLEGRWILTAVCGEDGVDVQYAAIHLNEELRESLRKGVEAWTAARAVLGSAAHNLEIPATYVRWLRRLPDSLEERAPDYDGWTLIPLTPVEELIVAGSADSREALRNVLRPLTKEIEAQEHEIRGSRVRVLGANRAYFCAYEPYGGEIWAEELPVWVMNWACGVEGEADDGFDEVACEDAASD